MFGYLSWKITDAILKIEDLNKFKCFYNKMMEYSTIQQSWSVFYDRIWVIATSATLVAVIGTVARRTIIYCDKKRVIFITILVLFISFLAYNSRVAYRISFSVYLMRERIASGEWPAIFCTLNAVENCTVGTIFI